MHLQILFGLLIFLPESRGTKSYFHRHFLLFYFIFFPSYNPNIRKDNARLRSHQIVSFLFITFSFEKESGVVSVLVLVFHPLTRQNGGVVVKKGYAKSIILRSIRFDSRT